MIASSLFANQEKADLSLNSDAHFKAMGQIKDHDRSSELKEIYGIILSRDTTPPSLNNLRHYIQEINIQIQKETHIEAQKDFAAQKDRSI